MTVEFILLLVGIGLLSGFVKGTSGFGSSLVAIPLLSRLGLSPSEIVTIMITCNIALNLLLVNEHKSYFHIDTVKKIYPIIITGIIFTVIGLLLNGFLQDRVIEIIAFMLILLAIIVKSGMLKITFKDRFYNLFLVGMFSGIGNGIASIDGPPVVLYLTGVKADKERFKSTLAIHFLIMGIAGIIILFILGNYNTSVLATTGILFCGLLVGLFTGMKFSRRVNEKQFTNIVLVLLVALATSLLIP